MTTRNAELVSQELHERFVRGAIDRWGLEPNAQHAVTTTDDFIA